MVASFVGLGPDDEYGPTDPAIESACACACFPAAWQEIHRLSRRETIFMAAMNSDEQTFTGIAYTDTWIELDEVGRIEHRVAPRCPRCRWRRTCFDGSTQSLCPLQVDEHLTIPGDGGAFAVAMAALAAARQLPELAAIDRAAVYPAVDAFVTALTLAVREA